MRDLVDVALMALLIIIVALFGWSLFRTWKYQDSCVRTCGDKVAEVAFNAPWKPAVCLCGGPEKIVLTEGETK